MAIGVVGKNKKLKNSDGAEDCVEWKYCALHLTYKKTLGIVVVVRKGKSRGFKQERLKVMQKLGIKNLVMVVQY